MKSKNKNIITHTWPSSVSYTGQQPLWGFYRFYT